MEDFDIPIFKKAYDLYRTLYGFRRFAAKQDRFTIWQRCENVLLELIEALLLASQNYQHDKLTALKQASIKLSLLRVFLRLMKDVKTIDNKKYIRLECEVDEIGRMLGGWIRATKNI